MQREQDTRLLSAILDAKQRTATLLLQVEKSQAELQQALDKLSRNPIENNEFIKGIFTAFGLYRA